jgi:hypothetical protein
MIWAACDGLFYIYQCSLHIVHVILLRFAL